MLTGFWESNLFPVAFNKATMAKGFILFHSSCPFLVRTSGQDE